MTSYSVGDPVQVNDEQGSYTGVIIEVVDQELLHVQMIKKDDQTKIYRITDDAYEVPRYAIAEHVHLNSDADAPKAFHKLGFRMLDGGSFVRHEDEDDTSVPLGNPEFDYSSSDDESDSDSMKDFIVPDEECDPFTPAEPTCTFVRETHQAVRMFNDWVPATEEEQQVKQFITKQEARAAAIDDDARFSKNMPGITSYSKPPL